MKRRGEKDNLGCSVAAFVMELEVEVVA